MRDDPKPLVAASRAFCLGLVPRLWRADAAQNLVQAARNADRAGVESAANVRTKNLTGDAPASPAAVFRRR